MMHYYFYFNLEHYPVALITRIGDNKQDQERLRMMQKLSQEEKKQTFILEPYTRVFDEWQEVDPRVRERKKHVNFIDIWRYHFSPIHSHCWEWLMCRSI